MKSHRIRINSIKSRAEWPNAKVILFLKNINVAINKALDCKSQKMIRLVAFVFVNTVYFNLDKMKSGIL